MRRAPLPGEGGPGRGFSSVRPPGARASGRVALSEPLPCLPFFFFPFPPSLPRSPPPRPSPPLPSPPLPCFLLPPVGCNGGPACRDPRGGKLRRRPEDFFYFFFATARRGGEVRGGEVRGRGGEVRGRGRAGEARSRAERRAGAQTSLSLCLSLGPRDRQEREREGEREALPPPEGGGLAACRHHSGGPPLLPSPLRHVRCAPPAAPPAAPASGRSRPGRGVQSPARHAASAAPPAPPPSQGKKDLGPPDRPTGRQAGRQAGREGGREGRQAEAGCERGEGGSRCTGIRWNCSRRGQDLQEVDVSWREVRGTVRRGRPAALDRPNGDGGPNSPHVLLCPPGPQGAASGGAQPARPPARMPLRPPPQGATPPPGRGRVGPALAKPRACETPRARVGARG